MSGSPPDRLRGPIRVAVLGGGVAGLTCADELVQRGFTVTIYDPRSDADLGGKARSYRGTLTSPSGDLLHHVGPAEHGFRFFPGFYRNINETLKHIPISSPLAEKLGLPDRETPKTALDCLVPIGTEVLAATGKPIIQLPASARLEVNTFRTGFRLPQELLQLGLTNDDLSVFSDKMWHIATSCIARRDHEYEGIPWIDFVESPGRSNEYYWYLASGLTRGLVAARANLASTKTMGNLALRFLVVLSELRGTTDRVLGGPTNVVWIQPWLDWIHSQAKKHKTEFKPEAVAIDGLELDSESGRIQGVIAGGKPHTADYFVAALPLEKLVPLLNAEPLAKVGGEQFTNLVKLQDYLRMMRGLQIYLKKDVPLNRGHQIYLDSRWGLTSISEAQFWSPRLRGGYLPTGEEGGVLSVDIASWDVEGIRVKKEADKCNPLEVFTEVVAEIGSALGQKVADQLFGPSYENVLGFHLDPDQGSDASGNLLVNNVGSWALRPEASTKIPNLFLAADFVRTETDLACMEGANEAARRAVNHLVDQVNEDAKRGPHHAAAVPDIPHCKVFSVPRSVVFTALEQRDSARYEKSLPWVGVGIGDWLVRATEAGAAAEEVVFAGEPSFEQDLIGQDGQPIKNPTRTTPTSRLPRVDRHNPIHVVAVTPSQVRDRLSPNTTAGRVDSMFQRWRPFQLTKADDPHVDLHHPRLIPFHAYDADALILYGKVNNFDDLKARAGGSKWYPVEARLRGKAIGFAELWIISYSDTTTGPYNELVINFVVTADRHKPSYVWSSDYSALVPMSDPANRLFTPALLLDERGPVLEGGPIRYGNELLGTDKKSAKIQIETWDSFSVFNSYDAEDDVVNEGRKPWVLKGWVDTNVSLVDSLAGAFDLTRQVGPLAMAQEYSQRSENAELSGGLVVTSGLGTHSVIQAGYKFVPTAGLFRKKWRSRFSFEYNDESKFGAILKAMDFEPLVFAHDPHLKTVLYKDTWPTPDDNELG